jgi:hypothetical protein
MCHAADSDKSLEIPVDELGLVVGDDPQAGLRASLACSLDNRFDFGLGHGRADLRVDDGPAARPGKITKCQGPIFVVDVSLGPGQ